MKILTAYSLLIVTLLLSSCKINLSFTGGQLSGSTFTIGDFPNYAPLVQPSLSQAFVDGLRNKIVNESNLKYKPHNPLDSSDHYFSGKITNYTVTPISATSASTAAMNRLSVSIEVVYYERIKKKNFTKTYTEFADFSIDENLTNIEDQLIAEIVKKLAQQVYLDIIPGW
ncbi:MAG: LPS assembly lipoprotein LptE [Flavobacteriales bacterium]